MAKLVSAFRVLGKRPHIQICYTTASRLFSAGSEGGEIYTPPDAVLPVPPYVEKQGETIELKRARLLYQSRKRGMLENGLLLSTFAGKHLDSLTDTQLSDYDRLINKPSNDWDIYYWVTGAKETPEEYESDVMDLLKKHVRNDEKDSRFQQPDL
ncbi:hypothetical protein BsWGS_08062 [Bradybaena similaris]